SLKMSSSTCHYFRASRTSACTRFSSRFRPPRRCTRCPYTALFRSVGKGLVEAKEQDVLGGAIDGRDDRRLEDAALALVLDGDLALEVERHGAGLPRGSAQHDHELVRIDHLRRSRSRRGGGSKAKARCYSRRGQGPARVRWVPGTAISRRRWTTAPSGRMAPTS